MTADFQVTIHNRKKICTLWDTGASNQLSVKNAYKRYNAQIRYTPALVLLSSASGSNISPIDILTLHIGLGKHKFKQNFIVWRNLKRSLIWGLDFYDKFHKYYTLCATQWQTNLTTSLVQDISTSNGWDSTKLEDWLTHLVSTTDILKESQACLAEAKSCSLVCTLISKVLQAEKCWDNIKEILHLKLCNANIYTYTSHFMEIQWRDSGTLAAYVHQFKTEDKRCSFNISTATICIFIKGLWHAPNTSENYKKDPQALIIRHQAIWNVQCITTGYDIPDIFYSQHDVQQWYVLSVERQTTLVAIALMHSVTTARSLATSPKIALTKSLY